MIVTVDCTAAARAARRPARADAPAAATAVGASRCRAARGLVLEQKPFLTSATTVSPGDLVEPLHLGWHVDVSRSCRPRPAA